MSHIENKILTEFINGTLPKDKMKEISSLIEKEMKDKPIDKSKDIQFDADFAWDKFSKKINVPKNKEKRIGKNYNFMRIAASIVLLIGISVLGYFISTNINNKTQYSEINSLQNLNEVSLPDGSIVSLNKNSTIKFPKTFNKSRIVEFSGEAFFKITKNPKSPFIIKSNNSEITVLGTSFNVDAKSKKDISVTVATGKVKLAKNKKEHVILVAGEFGEIKNNSLSKNKNSNKNFLSWKTKHFEYNGDKLKKVISDFNKVYGVGISVSSADIEDLPISTPFDNKPIEVALDIICKLHNLKYTKSDNNFIISKK